MSKQSIYDGLPYLYAEQLKGKAVTLTIKSVVGGVDFVSSDGRKAKGFNISFEGTAKMLGVTGVTVRRQLCAVTGTEDPAEMIGKRITLFPIKSAKAATGCAIRITAPNDVKTSRVESPAETGAHTDGQQETQQDAQEGE